MRKMWKLLVACLAVLMCLGGCSPNVELKQTVFDVELGEPVQIFAEQLVDTEKYDVKKIVIDTSAVDTTKVGSYLGILEYNGKKYEYTVNVVDTISPEIALSTDVIYMTLEDEIYLSENIANIKEKSGIVRILANEECDGFIAEDTNKIIDNVSFNDYLISFSELGDYSLTFDVADETGNSTEVVVNINVVNLPTIVAEDISIYKGDNKALDEMLNSIKVIDDIDGETSENITYDITQVNVDTVGEYTINITYVNSKNISNSKEIRVVVKERPSKNSNNGNQTTNNSGTQTSGQPKVTVSMPPGANPMVLQYIWREYTIKNPETGVPEFTIIEYPAEVSPEETYIEGASHGVTCGVWSNGVITYTSGISGFSLGNIGYTENRAYKYYREVVAYQPPNESSDGHAAYITKNGDLMIGKFDEEGDGNWYTVDYRIFESYGFSYDYWIYY